MGIPTTYSHHIFFILIKGCLTKKISFDDSLDFSLNHFYFFYFLHETMFDSLALHHYCYIDEF